MKKKQEDITFSITAKQAKKYNAWCRKFKNLPASVSGGHFSIEFIPTSIGIVIKGNAWNRESIDLTDYTDW